MPNKTLELFVLLYMDMNRKFKNYVLWVKNAIEYYWYMIHLYLCIITKSNKSMKIDTLIKN